MGKPEKTIRGRRTAAAKYRSRREKPLLRTLTGSELRRAYRELYLEAFPPNELRPLWHMTMLGAAGRYRSLGLFQGGRLCCSASLWSGGHYVLLDYLATRPACRGEGLGAALLARLPERFPSDTVFLLEVEAPEPGPEEALRQRRLAFYRRCGARELGYEIGLFGVRYRVLALGGPADRESAAASHARLYESLNSPALLSAVRIPLPPGEPPPEYRPELFEGSEA